MASWDDIKNKVEQNGNVATVSMLELRDANGSGRLGTIVIEQIKSTLAGMGLGHIPQELPGYQDELVRVYKHGTPIGDLIDTVLKPGEQNDNKLINQVTTKGADYASVIEKIRDLVGR